MLSGDTGVVLPCAGIGRRVGGALPKQFLDLGGHSIFLWSLGQFLSHPRVREVVLVIGEGEEDRVRGLLPEGWKPRLVQGGAERWQSVRNGVASLSDGCRLVLVHDAARPLVRAVDIDACLGALTENDACTLAQPAVDTIKWADDTGESVEKTLDRSRIWLTQTSQGFRREVLEDCYARLDGGTTMKPTDEAGLAEYFGRRVRLVPGGAHLRKVTTADDLEWAHWRAEREMFPAF